MFSALSVLRLYNASSLAAKESFKFEFLVEFRVSRMIEKEMARRFHNDLKC
jgi:hypothetical protein